MLSGGDLCQSTQASNESRGKDIHRQRMLLSCGGLTRKKTITILGPLVLRDTLKLARSNLGGTLPAMRVHVRRARENHTHHLQARQLGKSFISTPLCHVAKCSSFVMRSEVTKVEMFLLI